MRDGNGRVQGEGPLPGAAVLVHLNQAPSTRELILVDRELRFQLMHAAPEANHLGLGHHADSRLGDGQAVVLLADGARHRVVRVLRAGRRDGVAPATAAGASGGCTLLREGREAERRGEGGAASGGGVGGLRQASPGEGPLVRLARGLLVDHPDHASNGTHDAVKQTKSTTQLAAHEEQSPGVCRQKTSGKGDRPLADLGDRESDDATPVDADDIVANLPKGRETRVNIASKKCVLSSKYCSV